MTDQELLAEIEATLALVREARSHIEAEPSVKTPRGGSVASPWVPVLRDAASYLVRLTVLADKRGLQVPQVTDSDLEKLLA
jgi:hypothetical protein